MNALSPDRPRLRLDLSVRRAALGDRVLSLTDQEFTVLVALCGRAVMSREELRRVTGLTDKSARRVDGVLVSLRRALGPDAIRTIRGRGWMLQLERDVVGSVET